MSDCVVYGISLHQDQLPLTSEAINSVVLPVKLVRSVATLILGNTAELRTSRKNPRLTIV